MRCDDLQTKHAELPVQPRHVKYYLLQKPEEQRVTNAICKLIIQPHTTGTAIRISTNIF